MMFRFERMPENRAATGFEPMEYSCCPKTVRERRRPSTTATTASHAIRMWIGPKEAVPIHLKNGEQLSGMTRMVPAEVFSATAVKMELVPRVVMKELSFT